MRNEIFGAHTNTTSPDWLLYATNTMINNISRQDHLIGIAKASMIGGAGELRRDGTITSLINRSLIVFYIRMANAIRLSYSTLGSMQYGGAD